MIRNGDDRRPRSDPGASSPPLEPSPRDPRLARLAALLGREIEIRAVIGEKLVPLGDLAGAVPGADLMLLPRGAPVRLVAGAGAVDIGEGTAVETAGRLALRIDRLRPLERIAAELAAEITAEPDPEHSVETRAPLALRSPPDPA